MGTKRSIRHCGQSTEENLPVPPGFVSLTALTLKRTDGGETVKPGPIDTPLRNFDIEKLKTSSRQRPCMPDDQVQSGLAKHVSEESGRAMKYPSSPLPKGVYRGCIKCHDCVKVTAKWRPEESCLPVLDEAPGFHPTEEEFKDTMKYIAAIRPKAENFGICRIVPPPSWRPPYLLRDKKMWKDSKFRTRVQNIDGLKHLYLKKKLNRMDEKKETKRPKVLATAVLKPCDARVLDTEDAKYPSLSSEFEPGPEFSLQGFKRYADHFKSQYFCSNDKFMDPKVGSTEAQESWEPLIARVEGEYWRIINNPCEEIEVLCGYNLETQVLGSGFPIEGSPADASGHSEYAKTGWNLNNTPKFSGSILPFGCYSTSGNLIPKLSTGMCFSTRCWRKEDHHLYSLCYLHLGDPKVWYSIPGRYCFKFVEFIKKLHPQLAKHPALLHELVTQVSPSTLMSAGIPVYHCVQNPLEFVLIFPGTYHSEFDAGFNCSEAVCFAPFDWLPHGQNIAELYSDYCLKTSISHDKLLLEAAMDAVTALWESCLQRNDDCGNQLWRIVCGKNGILTKALKSRIKLEDRRREHLCDLARSRAFDDHPATKRECSICLYDLYLSAVGCSCSPNVYTCLRHGKQLCSCAWGDKFYFFRFEIEDLKLLVEALEDENLKAIHFWVKKKIQPLTDSFVSKDGLSRNGLLASRTFLGAKEENRAVTRAFPTPDSGRQNVSHHSELYVGSVRKGRESTVVSQSAQNIIVLSDEEDE